MFKTVATKRLLFKNAAKLPSIKHNYYYCQPHRLSTVRAYIRPHYYENSNSLSKALQNQRDPIQRFSRKMNNLNPNKVLWTVMGTNVGVFLMWQYAYNSYRTFGEDHWLRFMLRHFAVSPEATSNGRYHTLLTSCFSHQQLDHLAINMLVLHSMGQGVLQAIGVSRFLLLYASAGVVSNMIGNGYKRYVRPWLEKNQSGRARDSARSLGASGSIMGLMTFFACAFPKTKFLMFFVVPMPAPLVVGLYAAYDMYKASSTNTGLVDSAAHLGGMAYGAGYWLIRVRPLLRKGRWRF